MFDLEMNMEAKQLLRIAQPNGTIKDRLSAQKHSSPYLYIDKEFGKESEEVDDLMPV